MHVVASSSSSSSSSAGSGKGSAVLPGKLVALWRTSVDESWGPVACGSRAAGEVWELSLSQGHEGDGCCVPWLPQAASGAEAVCRLLWRCCGHVQQGVSG
jgi:hypothetical protein